MIMPYFVVHFQRVEVTTKQLPLDLFCFQSQIDKYIPEHTKRYCYTKNIYPYVITKTTSKDTQ